MDPFDKYKLHRWTNKAFKSLNIIWHQTRYIHFCAVIRTDERGYKNNWTGFIIHILYYISYRDVQKECSHCNYIYIYISYQTTFFSICDCFALLKLLCLFTFRRGVVVDVIVCIQYLSPLKLWIPIPLRWCVLGATLCDKVCQWLVTGLWFSPRHSGFLQQ